MDDNKYIIEMESGYQVRISRKVSHFFSSNKYGSKDKAFAAAAAYRDYYVATGEERIPKPLAA